jgi:hypothetical protein
MSKNQTVTLYGIEAELPPACPLMVKDEEVYLCTAQFGNSAVRCVSHPGPENPEEGV